jgi:hypothetical protein
MLLSRLQRKALALTTALLLALCQIAYAAQACAQGMAALEVTVAAPCHETSGSEAGAPVSPKATSVCDAPGVVGADIGFPLLSVADLPALHPAGVVMAPVRPYLQHCHALQTVGHPPPLTVLHCRFLN